MSGSLSVTLIISGVVLIIGTTFLLLVLPNLIKPSTNLWLGDGIFDTDIALTKDARDKGLSDLSSIGANKAMLFAYPSENRWEVKVKDMKFPVDAVWLNIDKKVIYIVKHASSDDTDTVYRPEEPAKYIIEFSAGTVNSKAIGIGSVAKFSIDGTIK